MEEKEKRILKYLEEAEELKNLEDIVIEFNLSESEAKKSLNKLKADDKILIEGNEKYKYYIAKNVGITADNFENGKTYILKNLVPTRLELDTTRDEMESLKKELKNIYANFIAVISVFIAIFSIISTSSNVLFQSAKEGWKVESVASFALVLLATIVAVLVMLWGVKRFLK